MDVYFLPDGLDPICQSDREQPVIARFTSSAPYSFTAIVIRCWRSEESDGLRPPENVVV